MIKVKLPMQRIVDLLSKPTTTVFFAREIADMLIEYEKHEIGTAYLNGYQDALKWIQEGQNPDNSVDVFNYLNNTYEND